MPAKADVGHVSEPGDAPGNGRQLLWRRLLGCRCPGLLRFGTQMGGRRKLSSSAAGTKSTDSAYRNWWLPALDDEPRYLVTCSWSWTAVAKCPRSWPRARVRGRQVGRGFWPTSRRALAPEMLDLVRRLASTCGTSSSISAPLDDGRQIIVPVDGYQITPVSRQY